MLFMSALSFQLDAEELYPLTHGALNLSYETLTLPGSESLGLAGMGMVVDLNSRVVPGWYGGLSAYGAMTGQRGGFFTGGFASGLSIPVRKEITLNAGLFVGGGGGGAAPQGGGLMLRPHIGLDYQWVDWRWGLQWSRVRFPNGAIDSEQWSLSLIRPLQFHLASTWLVDDKISRPRDRAAVSTSSRRGLSINQWSYYPCANTRNTSGDVTTTPMRLLGFSLDLEHTQNHYRSLQTAGALAGSADGYAEVLWGNSWRYEITGSLSWHVALALGAGGGGSVATGGGLLGRATIAFEYDVDNVVQVALTLGHIAAPQGDFSAEVIGMQLAYHYAVPTILDDVSPSLYQPQHWRVRGVYQSYRPYGDTRRKGQATIDRRRIDLLGSKIDLMLSPDIYITGQALGAFSGGAGGYAVGQFGLGWRYSLTRSLHANSELLLGVGGGGGLDVGGGQLVQAMVGLELDLGDRFSLIVSAGGVEAAGGSLRARVVDLAVAYRLSSPIMKE